MKLAEKLNEIELDSEAQTRSLYYRMRSLVIAVLIKKFNATQEEVADVYQQAFCILWEKYDEGQLKDMEGKPGAYLTGIAKNLLLERRRKKSGRLTHLEIEDETAHIELDEKYDTMHARQTMDEAFAKMGERCKNILRLYYYREYTMEAIALRMGLKNADVAKKTKYECLNKFREIYFDQANSERQAKSERR